jgi:hypothetical protein
MEPTPPEDRLNWGPAIASFFIPGLGQLIQGRHKWAATWFAIGVLAWVVSPFFFFVAPLLVHAAAAAEAALR